MRSWWREERSAARRAVLLGGALLLAVVCSYQSVWRAGFVWDDDALITLNPCVVGPLGLKEVWTTRAADICPLTITTFWAEHKLWGLAPLPYHLVTVFLHGVCAILLWRVILALRVPGAWLGAALWALHPVQVASVAWAVETKNTQSGLFYLSAILCFLRGHRPDRPPAWRSLVLAWLCAAAAMASKTSTVVLPAVLCLLAWWIDRRWHWRNLWQVGPVFVLSLAAGIWAVWMQKPPENTVGAMRSVGSLAQRIVVAGDALWFYLGNLAWPYPLIAVYPRWQIDPGSVTAWLAPLAILAVLTALWLGRRRPWVLAVALVLAYFVIALSPVLGFVDINDFRYSFVADHLVYLASMGPLALAGMALARWPAAGAAALLLAAGATTWHRAQVYESQKTLWTDTRARNPKSWVSWYNLGTIAQREGRPDEAANHYREALRLDPANPESHNDLGNLLFRQGKVEEAVHEYQAALQSRPMHGATHNNLGTALLRLGRTEEAVREYQTALTINPANAAAHNNLGNLLVQTGHRDEAADEYRRTLALDPGQGSASDNLAGLLLQSGRIDEAIAQSRASLRAQPGNAAAHRRLGVVLLRAGRGSEAAAEFRETLRLKPDDADARRGLAAAQAPDRPAAGTP